MQRHLPASLEILIARHGDQPSAELRASWIEAPRLSNESQEALLRDVFRVRNRLCQQPGETVNGIPMALEKQLKRSAIASRCPRYEFGVRYGRC